MGGDLHRIVFQELERLDVESLRLLAARYGVDLDVESIRDVLVGDISHAGMDRGKTTGTRRRTVDPDDCNTVETCGKRLLMLANNYNDHLLTKFRDFIGKVRQRGLKVTDVVNYSIGNHTTVLYKAVDVSPIADASLIRWVSPAEKVRLLLDNGASKQVSPFAVSYALKGALDQKSRDEDPDWRNVTFPALMNQRVEIVQVLLEKGFDPEGFQHENVKSPLFIACELGNKPLVDLLLRHRASIFRIYVPNTDSYATFEGTDGKQYVFRFNQDASLVEEKYNPYLKEYDPTSISLLCNHMEIFFQLVEKHNETFQDPNTDAEYKHMLVHDRENILSYAVILDDLETVKRLVEEYGFDVNQYVDNVRFTDTNALFQAARSNSKEILEYLLSKGADPYQAYIGDSSDDDWINSTPLWIACTLRFQWIQADLDTIKILLDHDNDPRMVKLIDTTLRFLELIVNNMERDEPLQRQQKQIYTSITTMLKDKRETLVNPVVTFEVTPTTPTERVKFIKENCPDDVTVDSETGEVEIGYDPISYVDLVDIEPANLLPIGKPLGMSVDDYVNDSRGKHCFSRESLAGEVAHEHIRPLKNTHTSTEFKEHEKAKIKEFLRRRPVFKGMETAATVVADNIGVSIRSRISSKIPNGQGLPYINENAMLGLTKQGVVDLAEYLSELSEGAANFDLDVFESAESDLHAVESFVDQVNAHPESSSIWTYISANPVLHPEDD